MNQSYRNITILLVILITSAFSLKAQIRLSSYLDVGKTNVSDGAYIKTSLLSSYQFKTTEVTAGVQLNAKYANKNTFAGTFLKVDQEFAIKSLPLKVEGLFLYNPFSNVMHESNMGVLIHMERTHFVYKLGTSFRTYRITNQAVEAYDIQTKRSLHENWNLMYLVRYHLKPTDHNWNVAIAITNVDDFLINQETNPMATIKGMYDVNSALRLNMEFWYKSAGSLNISANSFGYFFRAGLIWKIDFEK